MDETTTITPAPVLQIPTTLRSLIEALIFAAQEPLTVKQIQSMYAVDGVNGDARKIEQEEIGRIVEALNEGYATSEKAYRIVQIAGGYQFATLPVYADWLGKLYKEQARRKLSQASTETLAIVAYRQPITRPEIESIRGVDCDYVLKTLLEKDMVTIVGRATTVGRPLLYGTTKEFLRHFGLNDIADLPRPREIQEILGEGQFESERRMLEAQQGLQEKKEEDFKSRLPHIPKRKATLDDEVKIIPKQRVRDLKVEPAPPEEAVEAPEKQVETSEEAGTQTPVADELHAEKAPPPTPDEETPPPSEMIIQPQAFLTTENVEPQPEQHPEEPEIAAEGDAPSRDDTIVPPGPPTVEPIAEQIASLEEERKRTPEEIGSAEVAEAEPSEVSGEIRSEETAPALDEVEVQQSTAGPVEAAATNEELVPEEPVSPSPVNEEDESEVVQSQASVTERPDEITGQVDAMIEGTAQVLPPVKKEQPALVARPEAVAPASRPASAKAAPHPKSRWQSWKEKIQGFIKKLFA
jgi:segregation and condensation protein B